MDFWTCYNDVVAKQSNSSSSAAYNSTIGQQYNNSLTKVNAALIDFMRSLESEFKCSGVCNPGPFYWFADLWQGPPTNNCLVGIKNAFKTKPTAVGILLLVTFLLTIVTWITQFSMCCGKASKKH